MNPIDHFRMMSNDVAASLCPGLGAGSELSSRGTNSLSTKTEMRVRSDIDRITVLLVDDHVLVRRGFRRILDDEAHIAVVGEAGDGAEAVRMAIALKPRIVLMDCAMPVMDGLTATREIVKACPRTLVVILSMHSKERDGSGFRLGDRARGRRRTVIRRRSLTRGANQRRTTRSHSARTPNSEADRKWKIE